MTAARPPAPTVTARPETPTDTERTGLLVRNFDVARTHRVTIDLSRSAADERHEMVYRLRPGQVVDEPALLSAGEYTVHVDLAGPGSHQTRIDTTATSDGPVRIEVGNGVVSVDQGSY